MNVSKVFLLGVLCFQYANGQNGAVCLGIKDNPDSFKVVFTFTTNDPAFTGLESYEVSEDPNYVTPVTDGECANTTPGLSLYMIAYEIDTTAGSLPCGIQETGVDTGVYKFAIAPAGLSLVYTFTCDLNNLDLPAKVSQNNFETNHLMDTTEVNFTPGDTILIVTNSPGTTVAEVPIGWPIKLRLLYNWAWGGPTGNPVGIEFSANESVVYTQLNTRGGASSVDLSIHNRREKYDPVISHTVDFISSLRIHSLIVGNTAAFDDRVETVISNGCNTKNAKSVMKDIGLFKSRDFRDSPEVYDTSVFQAFRLDSDPSGPTSVWFRVEYEVCFGDFRRCNVCTMRRRSDDQERHTVDVELRVTDPHKTDQEDNEEGQGRTVCGTIVLYWAPHVLLLLITLVECAAISHVLLKKVQLR